MENLSQIFYSFTAFVSATVVVSEYLNRLFVLKGSWAQLRAIVVSLLLAAIGSYFNLGMFDAIHYSLLQETIILGLSAGIVANWTYATPLIKEILKLLKIKVD